MSQASPVLNGGTAVEELIPLTLLRAGQSARISQVFGASDLVHRLHEMGLRAGVQIEMIRPGNPCLVRLDGCKLGFRGDEATRVLVCACGAESW